MSKRSEPKPQSSPWKLLLWTAVAGLIFGLIGFGEVAEDWLRVARNSFHKHKASGDIVLLMIDDKSLQEIGNWPWPRTKDAQLVDKLTALGAKRIFFDINFSFPSTRGQDQAFAQSLARSGRVTLLARTQVGPDDSTSSIDGVPLPIFAKYSKLGIASVHYNYQNAVWRMPYAASLGGRPVPSFAASLANASGPAGDVFPLDYSMQLETLPSYSAGEVLAGRVGARQLAGKDIVIGIGTDVIGNSYFIPGYGKAFGVHVHAVGAETLKRGHPVNLGWLPGFVLGMLASFLALRSKRRRHRYPVLLGAITTLLFRAGAS